MLDTFDWKCATHMIVGKVVDTCWCILCWEHSAQVHEPNVYGNEPGNRAGLCVASSAAKIICAFQYALNPLLTWQCLVSPQSLFIKSRSKSWQDVRSFQTELYPPHAVTKGKHLKRQTRNAAQHKRFSLGRRWLHFKHAYVLRLKHS